jgi:large subunit ribosomal protein L3
MSLAMIARKKGMKTVFDQQGRQVVCSVVEIESNVVFEIKTEAKHGYSAVCLAGISLSPSQAARMTKPLKGRYDKSGLQPCRVLKESRLPGDEVSQFQVGQKLDLSLFEEVLYVDVEGVSKGKGYQGVIKLHNMAGGPAAHGSGFHRHMGSTGMRSTPGRCFPGGKRASRMGGETKTVQNLRVVGIHGKYLLLKGAIPGPSDGVVYVSESIKMANKNKSRKK